MNTTQHTSSIENKNRLRQQTHSYKHIRDAYDLRLEDRAVQQSNNLKPSNVVEHRGVTPTDCGFDSWEQLAAACEAAQWQMYGPALKWAVFPEIVDGFIRQGDSVDNTELTANIDNACEDLGYKSDQAGTTSVRKYVCLSCPCYLSSSNVLVGTAEVFAPQRIQSGDSGLKHKHSQQSRHCALCWCQIAQISRW